ncbi:MAG: hypothetical protein IKJ74_00925 [Clostridia bacterium]|nr:hypothetical protein [Clostridia bacterium]
MFLKSPDKGAGQKSSVPKEGDLFKVIRIREKTFEIRYGFYEERDRHVPNAEPMEIYPDFIRNPQHTDDGIPIITAIQSPCKHYKGKKDENSTCEECSFYQAHEELIGLCTCPKNKLKTEGVQDG